MHVLIAGCTQAGAMLRDGTLTDDLGKDACRTSSAPYRSPRHIRSVPSPAEAARHIGKPAGSGLKDNNTQGGRVHGTSPKRAGLFRPAAGQKPAESGLNDFTQTILSPRATAGLSSSVEGG